MQILKMINDMIFQRNIIHHNNYAVCSFYNTFKKSLHHIEKKNHDRLVEKKKYENKKIIYNNVIFTLNSILDIINKKNLTLKSVKDINPVKYQNIKKKKQSTVMIIIH